MPTSRCPSARPPLQYVPCQQWSRAPALLYPPCLLVLAHVLHFFPNEWPHPQKMCFFFKWGGWAEISSACPGKGMLFKSWSLAASFFWLLEILVSWASSLPFLGLFIAVRPLPREGHLPTAVSPHLLVRLTLGHLKTSAPHLPPAVSTWSKAITHLSPDSCASSSLASWLQPPLV